jgi:hypothetical protein
MEVEESDNPACAGFVFSPRNPPQALRYWYFAGTRKGIANVFQGCNFGGSLIHH